MFGSVGETVWSQFYEIVIRALIEKNPGEYGSTEGIGRMGSPDSTW